MPTPPDMSDTPDGQPKKTEATPKPAKPKPAKPKVKPKPGANINPT